MIQLTRYLLRQNPQITYISGPGNVGEKNLPIYQTFGDFLKHLKNIC